MWHQWLRYQRPTPPTLAEQRLDVARRQRMKVLAAEADARWAAKPSFLDRPAATQDMPPPPSAAADIAQNDTADTTTTTTQVKQKPVAGAEKKTQTQEEEDKADPWKKATASGPSEEWQPAAWSPTNARKR